MIYNLKMKNLLIVFIFFQLISHSSAKQEKEYKFNWYPVIDIKENVIKFPDSSRYETYNSSGVWEDNLGNYGIMQCIISQLINNNNDISLDGYCEGVDSEKEKFWLSLKRNSFNKAGVGQAKYLFGENKYNIFKSKECPYAALLIEGGGVFKLVCKLTNEENKMLKK